MNNLFQKAGADSPPVPGKNGASKYWVDIDPALSQVFAIMDDQDVWTIEDHHRVREMLDQVIAKMQTSAVVSAYCLNHPRQALELMAWMRSSSAMMLLHYSNEDRTEVIDRFLAACSQILQTETENEDLYRAASLATERFLVFERLALLKRLFSKDRTERVESAIQDAVSLARKNPDRNTRGGGK